jgi:hypothetical protein
MYYLHILTTDISPPHPPHHAYHHSSNLASHIEPASPLHQLTLNIYNREPNSTMGWLDGVSVVSDSHSRHHGHSSKKHHKSSGASIFGLGDDHHSSSHHNASRGSFFGLGDDHHKSSHHNASRSSFFGFGKLTPPVAI